jgi:hypothetical protein
MSLMYYYILLHIPVYTIYYVFVIYYILRSGGFTELLFLKLMFQKHRDGSSRPLNDLDRNVICGGFDNKVSYRSMGTTGDPVPVGQRDVPVNHYTG